MNLMRLPHYSTLKKLADRSAMAEIADAMFAEIVNEFAPLVQEMAKVRPKRLYADAGYDAVWGHMVCREHWNVKSFIPRS